MGTKYFTFSNHHHQGHQHQFFKCFLLLTYIIYYGATNTCLLKAT